MGEALAYGEVTKLGFNCTWLKAQEEIRTKHGRRIITTSIFPSYLFVAFDLVHSNWRRLVGRRGVKQILGSSPEKPMALPPGELDRIIGSFSALASAPIAGEEPKELKQQIINAGDTVLIHMGGQAPIVAKVKLPPVKERIRVLMEFMGGIREATFDMARVTLAPNQTHLKNI